MIDESLVARIYTRDKQGIDRVGTGYPLSENLLITALHVVAYPEQDTDAGIEIVWDECDHASDTVTLDDIVYRGDQQAGQYDLALLCCQTPLTHTVSLLSVPPPPHTECYCFGYPLAGLHKQKPQHDRLKFSGSTDGNSQEAELEITTLDVVQKVEGEDGFAIKNWQGLSGSPVIINQEIAGIVAIKYTTVAKKLFAVSLPHILDNCEVFRQYYLPDAKELYEFFLKKQKHIIGEYIEQIDSDSESYAQLLNLSQQSAQVNFIESLCHLAQQEPVNFLSKIRENLLVPCSTDLKDSNAFEQACNLYLLFVVFTLTTEHFNFYGNIHDLSATTRLATEVQLAARYGKPISLCRNPAQADLGNRNSLIGSHAIDAAGIVLESGWNPNEKLKDIQYVVQKYIYKGYEQVYGNSPKDGLDDFDIADLNETLLLRRNRSEDHELIRLEIDSKPETKEQHPLHDPEVCYALRQQLSNLIIARYGCGTMPQEVQLLAEIREFFILIERVDNNA